MTKVSRKCGNCVYVLKFTPPGQIQSQLLCKHSPPQMLVVMTPQGPGVQTAWPPVTDALWCDQFKTREAIDVMGTLAPVREESGNAPVPEPPRLKLV